MALLVTFAIGNLYYKCELSVTLHLELQAQREQMDALQYVMHHPRWIAT